VLIGLEAYTQQLVQAVSNVPANAPASVNAVRLTTRKNGALSGRMLVRACGTAHNACGTAHNACTYLLQGKPGRMFIRIRTFPGPERGDRLTPLALAVRPAI
jgi:hypothetical protein